MTSLQKLFIKKHITGVWCTASGFHCLVYISIVFSAARKSMSQPTETKLHLWRGIQDESN